MKLIEALKAEKRLLERIADLNKKVSEHSAYLDFETPRYEDQTSQVKKWMDSIRDTLQETERLRLAIQQTNILTLVMIELEGKLLQKSIASWIYRRRVLAKIEGQSWANLTDRGLQEARIRESTGKDRDIKIVRCYDPAEKDLKLRALQEEPGLIDSALEVVNASTDLME